MDEIWPDRPAARLDPVRLHSPRHAGATARDKLRLVREAMRAAGARAHVLAALDTIAWLFNVRGADVDFNPVVIAYAVVMEREARLFIDPRKITPELTKALRRDVKILPYAKLPATLRELRAARVPVLLDPATTNAWVADQLRAEQIVRGPSPVTALKAVKNPVQIRGVASAHVRDGVAMVKFLKWLEPAVRGGDVTELSAADRLEAFRAEGRLFPGAELQHDQRLRGARRDRPLRRGPPEQRAAAFAGDLPDRLRRALPRRHHRHHPHPDPGRPDPAPEGRLHPRVCAGTSRSPRRSSRPAPPASASRCSRGSRSGRRGSTTGTAPATASGTT